MISQTIQLCWERNDERVYSLDICNAIYIYPFFVTLPLPPLECCKPTFSTRPSRSRFQLSPWRMEQLKEGYSLLLRRHKKEEGWMDGWCSDTIHNRDETGRRSQKRRDIIQTDRALTLHLSGCGKKTATHEFCRFTELCKNITGIGARMSYKKWRENKQHLIWWPELVLLGCS